MAVTRQKPTLTSIKAPISEELNVFQQKFKESIRSSTPLLDRIMRFIVKRKGKQMRPILVFLSAKMHGEVNESTYTAASMVELLHSATLVHDDVVDDAHQRRGFFSINALWKNKIAVLVGDYLLSRGLLVSLNNREYPLLQILSDAVQQMSEGELLQIEKARRMNVKEDIYFDIIRQKTASLIAACCACGASSVGMREEEVTKMREMGEKIGIAFQIKDDLLDFGDEQTGKPKGGDIKEKKLTLPLIYTLQEAPRQERNKIINLVKNHHDKESINRVIESIHQHGGIDYARQKMHEYRENAYQMLADLPSNEASSALADFIQFTTERRK